MVSKLEIISQNTHGSATKQIAFASRRPAPKGAIDSEGLRYR
jgi:hypothetical protein